MFPTWSVQTNIFKFDTLDEKEASDLPIAKRTFDVLLPMSKRLVSSKMHELNLRISLSNIL